MAGAFRRMLFLVMLLMYTSTTFAEEYYFVFFDTDLEINLEGDRFQTDLQKYLSSYTGDYDFPSLTPTNEGNGFYFKQVPEYIVSKLHDDALASKLFFPYIRGGITMLIRVFSVNTRELADISAAKLVQTPSTTIPAVSSSTTDTSSSTLIGVVMALILIFGVSAFVLRKQYAKEPKPGLSQKNSVPEKEKGKRKGKEKVEKPKKEKRKEAAVHIANDIPLIDTSWLNENEDDLHFSPFQINNLLHQEEEVENPIHEDRM